MGKEKKRMASPASTYLRSSVFDAAMDIGLVDSDIAEWLQEDKALKVSVVTFCQKECFVLVEQWRAGEAFPPCAKPPSFRSQRCTSMRTNAQGRCNLDTDWSVPFRP